MRSITILTAWTAALVAASTQSTRFLNPNSEKFAVNGTGIPEVDFDLGPSYAGSLPVSADPAEDRTLYFWFFPSENQTVSDEIVIWINGGPGCSSLLGLLEEHGPFTWLPGTNKPVRNPWSWHRLTNVIYIDQPVGTGFAQGDVRATSEDDIAADFLGFWENLVETFQLQGSKVYVTGESAAGRYVPYIAKAMLDRNDTTNFDMAGVLMYSPGFSDFLLTGSIVYTPFVESNLGLLPLNDTFTDNLRNLHVSCGYEAFLEQYMTFPASGPMPPAESLPGVGNADCSFFLSIYNAMTLVNPCFDYYMLANTCPTKWDVLLDDSFLDPSTSKYVPYFDRADVKAALNAPPNVTWYECSPEPVFVNDTDTSPLPIISVLPQVIDATKNVVIAHGLLDFLIIHDGTLLSIQNMTFGGLLGFQEKPSTPFYVPYHSANIGGAGLLGTTHTERGLTFVTMELAGHKGPADQPAASFRQLEFLLGRIGSLDAATSFAADEIQ